MKPFDILVAGEINPDLILSGNVIPAFKQMEKLLDNAVLTVGSSAAIFACGAARLGLKVGFIGVCGDDVFGRFMLTELESHNVDTTHIIRVPGGQTGLTVILSTGDDRAILTSTGLMDTLKAEDISDDLLQQACHLHVASYFLQHRLRPGLPKLLQRARKLGLSTSLDTNWDPDEQWVGINDLLPHVDIFLPNEAELQAITHVKDTEVAICALSVSTLAVKLGRCGAMARHNTDIAWADILQVEVIDTTGAGDSFDAGFVYGYLAGWELQRTLRFAAACGSLSTRAIGGVAAQATLGEALKYV